MTNNNLDVPQGTLFCFSEGQYSDYHYLGHFLALEPLNREVFQKVRDTLEVKILAGEILDCYEERVTSKDDFYFEHTIADRFIPELCRTGFILSINCTELHLGEYGRFTLLTE